MKKETKAMNKTDLHIRRWVATVAILAALIGGGILALGLRNWSSVTVMGAAKPAVTMANDSTPVSLGSFGNGFSAREFDGRDLSWYLGLLRGKDEQVVFRKEDVAALLDV